MENKTPEEILEQSLKEFSSNGFYGLTTLEFGQKELIFEAMEEYGKQQYNQVVLDCIEHAEVKEIKGFGYGFEIDKESMKKLIKQ